ncbi:MAG: RNA 2',3'-cyclic phosphodiesterase [archaeon]
MRCFIGSTIQLKDDDKKKIKEKISSDLDLDYLHITYKFFRDLKISKVNKISNQLNKIKFNEFDLKINKIDYFEHKNYNVIYLNILKNQKLIELYKIIHDSCDLKPNLKRFNPHITLMRKDIKIKEKLDIETTLNNITFFNSKLTNNGPIHRVINYVESK